MARLRIRIRPLSAWATPWHAGTLFGCLAWGWRLTRGPEDLERILDGYVAGNPAFVVSDAFPEDYLPFPAGLRTPEGMHKAKAVWIGPEEWRAFAAGSAEPRTPALTAAPAWKERSLVHASLSRTTGTTEDGSLYEIPVTAPAPESGIGRLTVYAWCADGEQEGFLEALACAELRGFGKKGSSGSGAFAVEAVETDGDVLAVRERANGFVALSHFLPARTDPVRGAWRLHTRFPKFQSNQVQHFLKGTFVTVRPGAVFVTGGAPRAWYGRCEPAPREEFPKAIHYGLTLAAPVRLMGDWPGGSGGAGEGPLGCARGSVGGIQGSEGVGGGEGRLR